MNDVVPQTGSVVVFMGVIVFVFAAVVLAFAKTGTSKDGALAALVVAAWMAVTGGIIHSGVLEIEGTVVPAPMPYFLSQFLIVVALALSPIGKRLARLPLVALIGFQGFRLPLEMVLHQWHLDGAFPVQMTWAGENFDVVSGVLGLLFAVGSSAFRLPRGLAWFVNVVGVALLLNIARIALRSVPSPFQAYPGAELTLPFHLPYGWIVPMCVMPAMLGHLVCFRALIRGDATGASNSLRDTRTR